MASTFKNPTLPLPNNHHFKTKSNSPSSSPSSLLSVTNSSSSVTKCNRIHCVSRTDTLHLVHNSSPLSSSSSSNSSVAMASSAPLEAAATAKRITVAFPDDGAWKRFHKQLQHFLTVVCAKVREGSQRIVRIKEGGPKGRHVGIVDDLVQSGGTLIECQKVLAAHGATKVSAYVTHGIFPNRSWQLFKHDNDGHPEMGLANFWITGSCPQTGKQVINKLPFEILTLAGSIAATLISFIQEKHKSYFEQELVFYNLEVSSYKNS